MFGKFKPFHLLIVIALALGIAGSLASIIGYSAQAVVESKNLLGTGGQPAATGSVSGQPLPRFVSLKADKVNVRRGPSLNHKIDWIYRRKNLPVEVTAEYGNWRRIRDMDGDQGWIHTSLLSGKRMALASPRGGETMPLTLFDQPDATSKHVAYVERGVLGKLINCTGEWCQVSITEYRGWIAQAALWGVYRSERLE